MSCRNPSTALHHKANLWLADTPLAMQGFEILSVASILHTPAKAVSLDLLRLLSSTKKCCATERCCHHHAHAALRRADGEAIEVLALPLAQADAFMADDALAKSPGLLYGLLWLRSKYN